MSEPRYLDGDDAATRDECESCGNFTYACECAPDDPDRAHDSWLED